VELFQWPGRKRILQKRISDDVLYSVDWSASGEQLAIAGHDTNWLLFDIEKNQIQKTWSEHSRPVRSIRFLANPNPLVTASFDQTIRVWSTERTKAVRSLNNHTAEINAIAVSPIGNQPNSKMMVSVGQDKTIRFWQPMIGRMVRFARIPSVPICVEWDTQGRFAMIGCEDGKFFVVDSQTVAVNPGLKLFEGPIFCIARHPDQNLFAVGGSKNRWKLITPKPSEDAQNN
jgi:WD40 repeat protein